jgi:hypothetical protein
MKRVFVLPAILTLLSLTGIGQDPTKVAPDAYKLEFENEWVKVTRVHYAAHAKIPAHDHTETGAAYVYLNDSGKVIFKHINLSYGAITRPETKSGSVRLYKAVKEVHEVENPNDTPSDFLRVEFKTASDTQKSLFGKYYRETYAAGENFQKVQFENGQIRVTRLACAKACEVSATTAPVLAIALTTALFKSSGKGTTLEPGKTKWISLGKKDTLQNPGEGHAEILQFELKSKPSAQKEGEHAHPHE